MTEPVEFSFAPNRRYARRVLGHASRSGRAAMAAIAVVLILAGFGAITADAWAILTGLLALAVGGVLVVRLVASALLAGRRIPAAWSAPRMYTIDPDELVIHTSSFTAAYHWDAVARVVRVRGAYVIHFASIHGFVDVPLGAMTDDQRAVVDEILVKHGLLEGAAPGSER
jgi:hypothetical protein